MADDKDKAMHQADLMIFNHPLIQHKIGVMRQKETSSKEFRELVSEVAMLMAYEVLRDLPLEEYEIETPLKKATAKRLAGKAPVVVPVLRAGLGMVDGMLKLLPSAKVGHIGLFRDPETLEAVEYYIKLPSDIAERSVILLDPMLATGASAVSAIDVLKERHVEDIKFVCLISSPEGIHFLRAKHPDVPIFCAAQDPGLNDKAYIVPGLGDAGDRLFGTK